MGPDALGTTPGPAVAIGLGPGPTHPGHGPSKTNLGEGTAEEGLGPNKPEELEGTDAFGTKLGAAVVMGIGPGPKFDELGPS